jgi:hypothetical protein
MTTNDNNLDNLALMADEERRSIALNAAYEIDGLSSLIQKELTTSDNAEVSYLRGLAKRILELNSIVMSALDDECESTSALAIRFS